MARAPPRTQSQGAIVVSIDGADLRVETGFREFFLLFFLLLFFLPAGIGSLETSVINFVDHLQHGFHHAPGANEIRKERSDFRHGYSWRRNDISPSPTARVCCGATGKVEIPTLSQKSRQGWAPSGIFPLDGVGIRE